MRTIKFRGKSTDSNEWLFGDLVRSADMERCAILVNDRLSYDECEVNPCSIGQFTSLYDKNCKEIYEGDIIKWSENDKLYAVIFRNGMFYASIEECNKDVYGGFPLHDVVNSSPEYGIATIVGNIYDNPDLLKGGEE